MLHRAHTLLAILVALFALLGSSHARAQVDVSDPGPPNIPPELMDVGVNEHLQGQVPADATFQDETGKMVRLGDYFDGKHPVLLVLAYHSCPVLCSLVQTATLESMKAIKWTAGQEYRVLTISIDPRDTTTVAAAKRDGLVAAYGRPEAKTGWHFLVSNKEQIHKVTDAVGWQYKFDERQGQFAHPSAVTLLTPSGKVARYLYGIEFDPNDLRLGLLEASEGRSITTVDRLILFCYHYDPQDRKYTLMATRVMQLGGVVTMFTLGGFLALMWVRERKKSRNDNNGPKRPDDKNDSKKDGGVPKNPLPQGSHARA